MIRLFFYLTFIFTTALSYAQGIEFYREDLSFYLSQKHLTVDGIYSFCNVSNKAIEANIFYPFPLDSLYGNVDSTLIESAGSSIPYIQQEDGLRFKCAIDAYKTRNYRIKYRQELKSTKAEYILTTTQFWKKPFEIVHYKLYVEKGITITFISYPPDRIEETNEGLIYFWEKRDFMPHQNMVIEFDTN